MEVMGLHLPGAAFVHPNTPLRDALTARPRRSVPSITALGGDYTPIGQHRRREARSSTRIVALLATGGSTNHTLHLVAMARAAGIVIDWDDFDELSRVVPLLARDLSERRRRREPLPRRRRHRLPRSANCSTPGCCTRTCKTVAGTGLAHYTQEPWLDRRQAAHGGDGAGRKRRHERAAPRRASRSAPTAACACCSGNLGRARDQDLGGRSRSTAWSKAPAHRVRFAGRRACDAFTGGELKRDFVAVRALPGPARQRHAGAAHADAGARRAAGPGLPRRAGHRRPHVGRVGQGAGGDPRLARSAVPAARSARCATAT